MIRELGTNHLQYSFYFIIKLATTNDNHSGILVRDDCIKRKLFFINCCSERNFSNSLSNPQETKIKMRKENTLEVIVFVVFELNTPNIKNEFPFISPIVFVQDL